MLALFPDELRGLFVAEGEERGGGGRGGSGERDRPPQKTKKKNTYQEKDLALVSSEAAVESIGDLWVSGSLFVHLVDQRVEMVAKDVPMENPFRHQVKRLGHPQSNVLQDDETLGGRQNPNNLLI